MNRAPEMVAGTGGFCTELIRHTKGKLVGKRAPRESIASA